MTTSRKPVPPLTDIHWIDPKTDQGRFVNELHKLKEDIRFIRVMHACDFHYPYINTGAENIYYQLVKYYQPHLMAVGSDVADFALISTFQSDADENDGEDVLDSFEEHYTHHIYSILEASPDTILFFILGNHEKRIYDFILRQAPQIRNTIWRRFIEIARCGGRVHWLGEVDAARIGPLLLMHGNRTTLNPAKSMLEDVGYQTSVMAGHVHRISRWERRGEDFPVVAITSGCHCLYPPHYSKRKRMTARWQMGTALAEVDLQGREVIINNLEYQVEPDRLWLHFQSNLFQAENPRPENMITYEEYLQTLA